MDGNFSAEHMKMWNPQDDVALTDGSGYMVKTSDYESHLKTATENREVIYLYTRTFIFTYVLYYRNPNATITRLSIEQI